MGQAATALIPQDYIASKIYYIRGQKVMLDSDLAELYDVETKVLNQAVKRNIDRFPEDFMFQLSDEEFENLKSQIATSNLRSQNVTSNWGGRRTAPYAFTEHGTLMLSGILNSQRAIDVNILIIRTFVKLREILSLHQDVAQKIAEHDQHIANLYAHLEQILKLDTDKKNPIGYIWDRETE